MITTDVSTVSFKQTKCLNLKQEQSPHVNSEPWVEEKQSEMSFTDMKKWIPRCIFFFLILK